MTANGTIVAAKNTPVVSNRSNKTGFEEPIIPPAIYVAVSPLILVSVRINPRLTSAPIPPLLFAADVAAVFVFALASRYCIYQKPPIISADPTSTLNVTLSSSALTVESIKVINVSSWNT